MLTLLSNLPAMHLTHQRIFVRADLNVPLDHTGTILDSYRLEQLMPTLSYLVTQKCHIILATHLGRPKYQEKNLSTCHLVPWFTAHGFNVTFEPDLQEAALLSTSLPPGQILLLENLRFFAGEKTHDMAFAKELRACADIYVHDAFGLVHSIDTSVTLLPLLFDKNHRTIGFLIERELQALNRLMADPARPFMLVIGGGKVSDKIPLIKHLIDKVDILALCPAIVFSFLHVLGKQTGRSLIDEKSFQACAEILSYARERNIKILMPDDYIIARDTFSGPLTYAMAEDFPSTGVGIAIGKKTISHFEPYIRKARSIFYNGIMGTLERPETLASTHDLLSCISRSNAYTVIGGGDSAAVVQKYHLATAFDHVSTGGGATLAYLSGQKLPGLLEETFKH